MKTQRIRPIMFFLLAFCCGVLHAQAPPALVVNTGEATVKEVPTLVETTIEQVFQDRDLVVALAQAGNFEGRIRETLNNNKLYPVEITAIPPYLRSLPEGEVVAAVRLQFVLPRLGNMADRMTQVAQLRRTLNNMAETMRFHYTEPLWKVENPQQLEREAVARATENAYALAEAAANTLDNAISQVDSIEILGVAWNIAPEHPNMNEITCTAQVKVVYALHPNH